MHFKRCFICPPLNFTSAGTVATKFDQRMVEKRHAAFEPVRHAHPVFDLQQRRQQTFEVEMRHLVEIGFLVHVTWLLKIARKLSNTAPLSSRRQSISSAMSVERSISRK